MKRQLLKLSLRLTLALMALSTVATGFARKLSPDEAIQRANEFQQASAAAQFQTPNRISTHGNVTQTDNLSLAYTAEKVGAENTPAFYVFNNSATKDGGFIIASGDDRLRPVLAVVDNGTFDPRNLPDNLRWWLSQYEEEINAYLSSAAAIAAPAITASTAGNYYDNYASWSTIYPLVTTTWNQGDPYNGMCPIYSGSRCVTGCVATAMAQVINYHKYAKGQGGTHTYRPSNWTTSATVSYDFDNAKFDWNNMLDSYKGTATTTQKNAVANLMLACGVAVDMMYSPSSSGAYSPVNGLIDFLGYHEKTAEFSRSAYQSAEWEAMIYKELTQNRPVYYSGSSSEGGHAFVCDGYSGDGMFHINWGWGGVSDGAYVLSALNPGEQGIGSYEGGYNINQTFVRIITPYDPYLDEYEESRYSVKFNSDFTHTSTSGTNEYFNNSFYLMLAPSYPLTIRLAVCVVAADGSTVYIASSSGAELNQYYGWPSITYSVNFGSVTLAAGDYKVYPAFYVPSTNSYGRLYPEGGKVEFVNMTVSAAGKRTFKAGEKYNLEFSDINVDSQLYQQSTSALTYTVTNTSAYDFIDEIVYTLVGGSSSYNLDGTNMIIRGGESVTIRTAIQGTTKEGAAVPAGSYSLVFKGNKSGETFSSPTVNVTVLSGRDPNIPDADQIITSANRMPQEWLNGESLSIPISYSATKSGTVYLGYRLLNRNSSTVVYDWDRQYYRFTASSGSGSVGTLDFTPTKNLSAGEYDFVFYNYYNSKEISQRVPVTVGLTEGGITYRLAVDGTFSRAVRLESATATEISIPASISTASKSYPVKEISTDMMANNTKVTRVNIPASVTTIGNNAFKNVTALKYLFFDGATVPLQNAQTAFSGCDRNMEVYVPGEAWSGYNSAFGQIAKVYAKITGVKVDTDITVNKGQTVKVPVTTTPAQNTNPNFTVTTTSSTIATATVENGQLVVKGIDNGAVTITLSSAQPGVNFTRVNVTVSGESSDVPAESITLDKETLELTVGETATLTAIIAPDNTTDKTVIWTSDNEEVATVDAEGEVTAIAVGEAMITATCGEVSAECKVTVNPVVVDAEGITLDKETLELKVGETAALTATVLPDNTTDKTVTWASSNPDVATVNADGMITAVAVGEAVITATCGEVSAECKVTVNPVAAESVKLDKETLELKVGETAALTATVLPDNATDKTVTWASSNPDVATVNADGMITAVAVGEAVITATCGEVSAECKVTVNPVAAESVKLDKETLELKVGETAALTATVLPDNATDKTVTWSSSNPDVATVNADGMITAVAVGEAVITATCGEATAECKVTVTANSGIDAAQAGEPVITLTPKTINVSGVADDCEVRVYTHAGQLIASETGCCSVAVANRGVYIVKVGSKTVKVSVTR